MKKKDDDVDIEEAGNRFDLHQDFEFSEREEDNDEEEGKKLIQ